MHKATFTYRQLDESLRALGFSVRTLKGKARIYQHEPTGARIFLPDAPFDREALPAHLVVARHVLDDYDLGEIENGRIVPAKASNQ
jgi:hypothetical protein